MSKIFTPPTQWSPGFLRSHPAFLHLGSVSEGFDSTPTWPTHGDCNALLAAHRVTSSTGAALRAMPQPPRSARSRAKGQPRSLTELYDSRICLLGEMPTRERSWHDLFNALVWTAFSRSKSSLNARQHRCHSERLGPSFTALPNARTREQDTLTILDEGSALLLTKSSAFGVVRELVVASRHAELAERVRAGEVVALLFGHALYEHLIAGDDEINAMPVLLSAPDEVPETPSGQREMADGLFAARLDDPTEFTAPNGVSGVPLRVLFDAIRP